MYMKTVGVGELRQNLSRYLKSVKGGERLVVTERNRPVAEIGPLRDTESAIEALMAEGVVRQPVRRGRRVLKPVKLSGPRDRPGTAALDEGRDEDR